MNLVKQTVESIRFRSMTRQYGSHFRLNLLHLVRIERRAIVSKDTANPRQETSRPIVCGNDIFKRWLVSIVDNGLQVVQFFLHGLVQCDSQSVLVEWTKTEEDGMVVTTSWIGEDSHYLIHV